MTALLIGEAERAKIAELRAFALGNIREVAEIMAAAGADMDAFRDAMQVHCMALPAGFRVCYSLERQPAAPPPGICAHLSVSVDTPGRVPSPEAVDMILEEFGMGPHCKAAAVWVEDISPGEKAVNVVELLQHMGEP